MRLQEKIDMDDDKPNAQHDLMAAAGFTLEDLEANRAGMVSKRQREKSMDVLQRTENSASLLMGLGIGIIALFIVIVLPIAIMGSMSISDMLLIVLGVLLLPALAVIDRN